MRFHAVAFDEHNCQNCSINGKLQSISVSPRLNRSCVGQYCGDLCGAEEREFCLNPGDGDVLDDLVAREHGILKIFCLFGQFYSGLQKYYKSLFLRHFCHFQTI